MIKSVSAGGVVVNKIGDVLVVSQHGTSWSLPKGHIEQGEDLLETAKREIEEESGINDLKFVKELGNYERTRINDASEIKTIHMYLFTTEHMELKPIDKENPEARWVKKDEVEDLLTAEKDKEFFRSVKDLI